MLEASSTGAEREGGETGGAAAAVNRALHANTKAATASGSYDLDARAIAKVLVRHYGDEAEAVLDRARAFLDDARRTKR